MFPACLPVCCWLGNGLVSNTVLSSYFPLRPRSGGWVGVWVVVALLCSLPLLVRRRGCGGRLVCEACACGPPMDSLMFARLLCAVVPMACGCWGRWHFDWRVTCVACRHGTRRRMRIFEVIRCCYVLARQGVHRPEAAMMVPLARLSVAQRVVVICDQND